MKAPVWLIGTSRGTQSAAFLATQLTGRDGPDGLVLTSTILTDNDMPPLMSKLAAVPRKELVTFKGGQSRGDPCEAFAYHGL